MHRLALVSIGMALAGALAVQPATAAMKPKALEGVPAFEVAEGRVFRGGLAPVYDRAPARAEAAWADFSRAAGGEWQVMWNPETGIPQRIFGAGIPAPGAVGSPASAEAHARKALRNHLALLAPGSELSDFELAANHLDDTGLRTVSFLQHHEGLRVLGGQVSFRFRNDRLFMIGSEALPDVQVSHAFASVAAQTAVRRARGWVERDFAPAQDVSGASEAYILPIVRGPGRVDYRTVKAVLVEAPSVHGAWEVYVDGITGAPVARRQMVLFAGAHINLDVPVRHPRAERTVLPASFLQLSVEGLDRFTDVLGYFTWASGSREVNFSMRGPYAAVRHAQGDDLSFDGLEFRDGDEETFGAPDDEFLDAQVSTFAHLNIAKEYVRGITTNPWLDQEFVANVNVDATCNANYNGGLDQANFFVRGIAKDLEGNPIPEVECANTGRLADVVYHEFGHGIHTNSIIEGVGAFDRALSEGVSDYIAATITNDPGMGRGFFIEHPNKDLDAALRHIDPEAIGEERKVYPDDLTGEEHNDGEIIGATLWDMRKQLVAKHGQDVGVAEADRIWYGIIQRAADMPSAYAEALAADDDDGDLTNGTPNSCIINRAFGAGGLGDGNGVVVPGVGLPTRTGYDLSFDVTQPEGCEPVEIGSAQVHWNRRDDVGEGTLNMEPSQGGYALKLPEQEAGTLFRYQVEVIFQNGSTAVYPNNPADPYYQYFVGETEDVYCTNFDTDPMGEEDDEDKWFSDADRGEDNWEWGEPQSRGLGGAPFEAYEGVNVLGTDLGENTDGLYEPDSLTWVESPVIDIYGREHPRLQFRRWLAADTDDHARIYVNDQLVWESGASEGGEGGAPDHLDREWAFHDIDLSAFALDGEVQVRFEMESDDETEMAGWAIDDFCVVNYIPPVECPDFDLGETCDGECPPECDPPDEDEDDRTGADGTSNAGCGCAAGAGGGPSAGALFLTALVGLTLLRRRRHA